MRTLRAQPFIPNWLQGTNTANSKVPIKVLARKMVKRRNAAIVQYLVQWDGLSEEQASWEYVDVLEQRYPNFQP